MTEGITIKRTTSDDPHFQLLIERLDHELWNELKEDQSTYDQYNKVPDLQTVVLIYAGIRPVACGCFKKYDAETVEIKRMFVEKDLRGQGLSKLVLAQLEEWASGLGYRACILETSVHFETAKRLYSHAGYRIIENYDQYKGLDESICMRKQLVESNSKVVSINEMQGSRYLRKNGIEYFDFEDEFIEDNIRCIPMFIRFRLDKAGIKLKLEEWSRFTVDERTRLATQPCDTEEEVKAYTTDLQELIRVRSGNEPTFITTDSNPSWEDTGDIPTIITEKAKSYNVVIPPNRWRNLTRLQRFALVKLAKQGHESKNFSKALKEFGLAGKT